MSLIPLYYLGGFQRVLTASVDRKTVRYRHLRNKYPVQYQPALHPQHASQLHRKHRPCYVLDATVSS
jgi:hypothetical protein